MNFNHYTSKAAEALQEAQNLAVKSNHARMEAVHLFHMLLKQPDGYVPVIIKKILDDKGENSLDKLDSLKNDLTKQIMSLPKITGSNAQI